MAEYFVFDTIYYDPLINNFNVISLHVITISSLLVNVPLYYLISRADHGIGNYRYLLLTFAAQDIIFTVIHHFVYPVAESYENTFLVSGQGSFSSNISMCIFFGVFGSSSPLVMGSFCYRLMQLNKQIRFYCFYAAMMAYTLFTAFVWFAVGRFACTLDDDVWSAIGPFLNGTIPSPVIHSAETADHYIMALYWTRKTFDGVRLPSILGMCALNVLLTLNYVVMTYCTVQMKRQLNIHNLMSAATLRMQRQLLRSLIGQMIFPLVTIYAACMIAMVPPMIGFHSPLVSITNPNLCGLHPLADGVVLLITVSHYRKEFVGLILRRRSSVSVHQLNTSHSLQSSRTLS